MSGATKTLSSAVGQFFPSFGGGGGSSDTSGEAMAADEARKAALRKKIDALYGIAPEGARPAPPPQPARGLFKGVDMGELSGASADGTAYDEDAKTAADAKASMDAENTKLSDATRSYYTDELSRQYAKAERSTRFALARQGLLGGSADADEQGEVSTDRNLGATRVDEAVRRAVTSLQSQREQERLNAVNLVNSGAGDSAVTAAQRGLQNSFDNANTQQKANLFSDLFSTAADATTASNLTAQQAALLARSNRLGTFFGPSTSTGQVTAGSGGRG